MLHICKKRFLMHYTTRNKNFLNETPMKKLLLSTMLLMGLVSFGQNIVYSNDFTSSVTIGGSNHFTYAFPGNDWTITTTGHDEWQSFNITFPTALNFQTAGNLPHFYMRAKSTANVVFTVLLVDGNGHVSDSIVKKPAYAASLSPNVWEIDGTSTYETFEIDFARCFRDYYGNAGNPQGAVDSTNITKMSFTINPGFASQPIVGELGTYNAAFNGTVSIDYIYIGAAPTSTNDASSLIASSKLYPNPTNDNAKVELNLNSTSDVKITLSDVMGKEVMTIAQGTYASLNETFSVADLNKGIYTVNYTVNGAPAKSELLMVK